MSKTSKFLWGILIIIIIIGVIALAMPHSAPQVTNETSQAVTQTESTSTGIASSTDTSNAALGQDLSSIDAQMNNLNTDNAGLNTSLQNQ